MFKNARNWGLQLGTSYNDTQLQFPCVFMFDRIACGNVRIRARAHFVMFIIKSRNLISVHLKYFEKCTSGPYIVRVRFSVNVIRIS